MWILAIASVGCSFGKPSTSPQRPSAVVAAPESKAHCWSKLVHAYNGGWCAYGQAGVFCLSITGDRVDSADLIPDRVFEDPQRTVVGANEYGYCSAPRRGPGVAICSEIAGSQFGELPVDGPLLSAAIGGPWTACVQHQSQEWSCTDARVQPPEGTTEMVANGLGYCHSSPSGTQCQSHVFQDWDLAVSAEPLADLHLWLQDLCGRAADGSVWCTTGKAPAVDIGLDGDILATGSGYVCVQQPEDVRCLHLHRDEAHVVTTLGEGVCPSSGDCCSLTSDGDVQCTDLMTGERTVFETPECAPR